MNKQKETIRTRGVPSGCWENSLPLGEIPPKSGPLSYHTNANWETVSQITVPWSSKGSRSWTQGKTAELIHPQAHLTHIQLWPWTGPFGSKGHHCDHWCNSNGLWGLDGNDISILRSFRDEGECLFRGYLAVRQHRGCHLLSNGSREKCCYCTCDFSVSLWLSQILKK